MDQEKKKHIKNTMNGGYNHTQKMNENLHIGLLTPSSSSCTLSTLNVAGFDTVKK